MQCPLSQSLLSVHFARNVLVEPVFSGPFVKKCSDMKSKNRIHITPVAAGLHGNCPPVFLPLRNPNGTFSSLPASVPLPFLCPFCFFPRQTFGLCPRADYVPTDGQHGTLLLQDVFGFDDVEKEKKKERTTKGARRAAI